MLALTCPSTGGDRGTANSVGSCSRRAAGLSSGGNEAHRLRPNASLRQRSEPNKTVWLLCGGCSFASPFSSAAITFVVLSAAGRVGRRRLNPAHVLGANTRSFILSAYCVPNHAVSWYTLVSALTIKLTDKDRISDNDISYKYNENF